MISKKLLGAVFGNQVVTDISQSGNNIEYSIDGIPSRMNIYEVAHRCKEWANENDYTISSHHGWKISEATPTIGIKGNIMRMDTFTGTTEPEAVFKACEWILEQENE